MLTDLTLSEAFEIYRRDYIVYRNQSPKTEEMHLLALKSLVSFLGDVPLPLLSFQNVRDWKEYLEKSKGKNTVRGYILKLRVVLAFMQKNGYKVLDPDVIGVPKRQSLQIDFITEDEVTQLIEASFEPRMGYAKISRYKNRAVISLLYASGIRVSELCRINRSDLQRDNSFTVVGKGDKIRLCFLDERTRRYISDYLELRTDNDPSLFLSDQTGKRITVGTVQEIFRVARVRAGFTRPIHPHTMRHSYATNLLRNNTNLLYVSKFLGHSSVQTTEMYTHVVDEDLRREYLSNHTV